jgi:hypothetical protein
MNDRLKFLSSVAFVALSVTGVGCTTKSGDSADPPASSKVSSPPDAGLAQPEPVANHVYQSTASVGDFLVVTIDKQAHTVSYENKTNGWAASDVHYTVDAQGMYTFEDPNGHLNAAIELEDYALVLDVDKAGPHRDTRAIAIGALAQKVSLADMTGSDGAGKNYLHMQFRTSNGGMEIGYVNASSVGTKLTVQHESYWPRGAGMMHGYAFHVAEQPLVFDVPTGLARGDYIQLSSVDTSSDEHEELTLFKTGSGFAFDMSNGNMILIDQPVDGTFNPAWAGSYRALAYEKRDARGTSAGEAEPGTSMVHLTDLSLSESGHLSGNGGALSADLIPVASASWLTGPGKLDATRARGLFTFHNETPGGTSEVFVCFVRNGFLFASFRPGNSTMNGPMGPMNGPMGPMNGPMGPSSGPMGPSSGPMGPSSDSYGYFYGAALRATAP